MSTGKATLGLIGWIGLGLLAGALGSIFTSTSVRLWYPNLIKPTWTPPNAVFGPVWTMLYILMGISAWLVWRRGGPGSNLALGLFVFQLALNVGWSAIFFGLRLPGLAFAEIIVLWLAILATMIAFCRIQQLAAYLLFPYLLWVSFAAALNFAIWRMNP